MSAIRGAPTRTSAFFEELAQRSSERLVVATASGTVRFDVDRDGSEEHWRLRLDRGTVAVEVAGANTKADAVLCASGELFDRIVAGEANPISALLRGVLEASGNLELLLRLSPLFPLPPRPDAAAGGGDGRTRR